jgi:hypothetical protein
MTRETRAFESTRIPGSTSDAYTDDGGKTWRWVVNDHCVPMDCLDTYGIPADPVAQQAAITAAFAVFRQKYIQTQSGAPSDEMRAEARAAHGAGVELVDVISGRRWTT